MISSIFNPYEDDNEAILDDMSDDFMQNNEYYDTNTEYVV